jgi:hypothetical protein
MAMASKETTSMPRRAHLAGRVVGVVEQAELDHRRHQREVFTSTRPPGFR